jgi:hypothetical protein
VTSKSNKESGEDWLDSYGSGTIRSTLNGEL